MQNSIKKEFKDTFKVAKKEYILRFINAIFIRGILLVLPVLISYTIEDVSKNKISSAFLLIIISIIIISLMIIPLRNIIKNY